MLWSASLTKRNCHHACTLTTGALADERAGRNDIVHAELYGREAEQKLMAKTGMDRLSNSRRLKVITAA